MHPYTYKNKYKIIAVLKHETREDMSAWNCCIIYLILRRKITKWNETFWKPCTIYQSCICRIFHNKKKCIIQHIAEIWGHSKEKNNERVFFVLNLDTSNCFSTILNTFLKTLRFICTKNAPFQIQTMKQYNKRFIGHLKTRCCGYVGQKAPQHFYFTLFFLYYFIIALSQRDANIV